MIIENEKKSQERKKPRTKKQETQVTEEVQVEPESEGKALTDGMIEVSEEPEPVVSEEKTTAEEIIDESKSE